MEITAEIKKIIITAVAAILGTATVLVAADQIKGRFFPSWNFGAGKHFGSQAEVENGVKGLEKVVADKLDAIKGKGILKDESKPEEGLKDKAQLNGKEEDAKKAYDAWKEAKAQDEGLKKFLDDNKKDEKKN